MAHVALHADPRTEFGNGPTRRLRQEGRPRDRLPVGLACLPIGEHDLRQGSLNEGRTGVIDLVIGDSPARPVLVKDWQLHPVHLGVLHVDFQQVDLTQEVEAPVQIVLVGTAAGVREGGVLDQPLREVVVSALPDSLPDHIEIDVTELPIGHSIAVGEITTSEGVTVVTDPETVVASVVAPSSDLGEEPEEEADPSSWRTTATGAATPPTSNADEGAMDGPTHPIRLVAGLGNPGPRYSGTRHNAGQMVVELLAVRLDAGRRRCVTGAAWPEARGPAGPLALLIPQTFMNESGDSVGPAAGSLHAAPGQVLVVHDELDLPFGAVRGKLGGGHGGHNGLRSVNVGLGTGEYPRLRLGIGRPPDAFRGDGADWVLSRFTEPRDEVEAMIARAADMAEAVLAEGMAAAIERFHAAEPGSRARERGERREARRTAGPRPSPAATAEAPSGE